MSKSTEEYRQEMRQTLSEIMFDHSFQVLTYSNQLRIEDAEKLFDQEIQKRVEEEKLKAKIEFAYFARDNATLEDIQWLDKRIAEMKEVSATLNKHYKEGEKDVEV